MNRKCRFFPLTPDWQVVHVHLVPVVVLDRVLEGPQLLLSQQHLAELGLGDVGCEMKIFFFVSRYILATDGLWMAASKCIMLFGHPWLAKL